MHELISVIVPVFNVSKYLKKCLDSILTQTYSRLEIILIDDGSFDGSEGICDEYGEKDDRIRVIHQKNSGVSAARNAGLEAACGDFICFSDSDDYMEPDMLERLHNASEDMDIAICNFYLDYSTRQELFFNGNLQKVYSREEAVREILAGGDYPVFLGHLWHKLFRQEVVHQLKFDPGSALYEDVLFVIQAFLKADRIYYLSYAGYHYVQRISSMMNSKFSEKTYSSIEAAAQISDIVKKELPVLNNDAISFYLTANLKQAALCVYSEAPSIFLHNIRSNLRRDKNLMKEVPWISFKNKIYVWLIRLNINTFIIFYRFIVKPNRRRHDKKLSLRLYPG